MFTHIPNLLKGLKPRLKHNFLFEKITTPPQLYVDSRLLLSKIDQNKTPVVINQWCGWLNELNINKALQKFTHPVRNDSQTQLEPKYFWENKLRGLNEVHFLSEGNVFREWSSSVQKMRWTFFGAISGWKSVGY